MCVVYTVRMSQSHFPLENPIQVCSAASARLRTVVHPNGTSLFVIVDVIPDRDEFLRDRIALFPNPQI